MPSKSRWGGQGEGDVRYEWVYYYLPEGVGGEVRCKWNLKDTFIGQWKDRDIGRTPNAAGGCYIDGKHR